MARSTMAALILRVRDLINDPAGASQTWTDDLTDVFPGSIMADLSDRTSTNAIDLSKSFDLSLPSRSGTDSAYIVIGKIGFANRLSFGLSALCITILRIIGTSAKEKMVRTNTRGIITTMADGKFIRNRAINLCIGKAVGTSCTPFASHGEQSMSRFGSSSIPKPAISGFVNFGPEGFCNVFTVAFIGAFIRAIGANLSGLFLKGFAAYNARTLQTIFELLGTTNGRAKTLYRLATLTSDERLPTCFTDKFDGHEIYLHMFDISLYHNTRCSRQDTVKVLGVMAYGC